jgi:hypothetical protein
MVSSDVRRDACRRLNVAGLVRRCRVVFGAGLGLQAGGHRGFAPARVIIARGNDPPFAVVFLRVSRYMATPLRARCERRAADSCPTVTKSIDAITDELHDEA